MHGLWGDSWVGLKLSGQDLRTWLLYHHQAIACCGTDCSSICFVWLTATLKVITSGTKRPCELQKPLPIARLWLFNISVHVPMKSSGWDAGLFIKSTQETMLLGKYIQPWPLRDKMKYGSTGETAKRVDMRFGLLPDLGDLWLSWCLWASGKGQKVPSI